MQQQDKESQPCWNIFTRELERVLSQRGQNLEYLEHLGIDQETVFRLKQSLDTPSSQLPLLDTEEIEQVVKSLQLDRQDILRLKAAILAIATQRELNLYILQNDAQLAAEQIYPIVFQSLQEREREKDSGNYREGDIEAARDSALDFALRPAWSLIYSGREKLNQSREVTLHSIRVKKAKQAYNEFSEALDVLDDLSRSIKQTRYWKHWYGEAQKGLSSAKKRLAALGE
ncbi:hypothetical protein KSF_038570 [Reticulibacter mediterranei]|uniref:Uncharacterized protein n=1 Tax=Reticulibacter mediterranei TaxID=2778369 RepID=A0A8J3IEC2_9CHLR|nr:hypothetical protein [Reticulibacter mediterranei]GHO93809.1 hypothetical protein KSF_038570 [Reticulibacter mediterranei]